VTHNFEKMKAKFKRRFRIFIWSKESL